MLTGSHGIGKSVVLGALSIASAAAAKSQSEFVAGAREPRRVACYLEHAAGGRPIEKEANIRPH